MNRHLYICIFVLLCSNYLTTVTNYRPKLGGGTAPLLKVGHGPLCFPLWLWPCAVILYWGAQLFTGGGADPSASQLATALYPDTVGAKTFSGGRPPGPTLDTALNIFHMQRVRMTINFEIIVSINKKFIVLNFQILEYF